MISRSRRSSDHERQAGARIEEEKSTELEINDSLLRVSYVQTR